jgi:hypothetical protein
MARMNFPLLPSIKFTPLISFDTILDLDAGLIELIRREYADPDVFDIELLKLPDSVLVSNLYYRPYKNPLYTIRNRNMKLNNDNIKLLDDYYLEFMKERYDDILQYAIRTDMDELIVKFDKAKDITVYIMVNTEREAKQIQTIDELSKIPIVYLSTVDDSNTYNQIYLKYLSDYRKLPSDIKNTTFYFSDCGVNLDNENRPRDEENLDIFNNIIQDNQLSIYNMYREDVINKGYLEYFKDIIKYDIITEE